MWTSSPRYFSGVVTAIVTWLMLALAIGAWWFVCKRENRKRDATKAVVVMLGHEGSSRVDKRSVEDLDLTDKQDKAFRYTW